MGEDLLPGDLVHSHPRKNPYAIIRRAAVPQDIRAADEPCYDFKDKVALVLAITELLPINEWAMLQHVCLLFHSDGTYGWEWIMHVERVDL